MNLSEIQLYEVLKAKFGEREATAFITLIENKVDRKFSESKAQLAHKDDIAKLELLVAQTKIEVMRWMFGLFITLVLTVVGLYFK